MQKKLLSFIFLLFICALAASVPAWANFSSQWTSTATDTTYGTAWGDYDADGDLDQLVANLAQSHKVYRNDGGGTFSNVWNSGTASQTYAVAWGDYDNDGDLDQFVGNMGDYKAVYRNNGFSSFTPVWYSTDTANTTSIAVGDFDNDGWVDLLAGNYAGPNTLYRNLGTGSFAPVWDSAEADSTTSVAFGDYDRDGDLDILVGNMGVAGEVNRVYKNTGGVFALVWSTPEADVTRDAAWGDYDGDGDLDILVANGHSLIMAQANRVYRNDGGDSFSLVWTSAEVEYSSAGAWGDYDGDGDPDQVIANASGTVNRVYRNDGAGVFTAAWATAEAENSQDAAWGDYDGDGDLDFAVANENQENRVYRNDVNPANSAPAAPAITAEPNGLPGSIALEWTAPADDITPAVLLTYQVRVGTCAGCDNVVSELFVPPAGNASTDSFIINLATGTYYWSVAAIDDTGFRKSSWATEDSFILTSSPIYSSWTSPSADSSYDVAWADLDVDGDLDQFEANYGSASRVNRNNGDGTFTNVWIAGISANTAGVAVCDYDGDGDLDIAMGNYGQQKQVYRNNGGMSFTLVWISPESDYTVDIDCGDHDGDGDADLLVGNWGLAAGQANRIYRNNGGMSFTSVWTSAQTDRTRGLAWGDYDNDGDLDQLALNDDGGLGEANRVYRNDSATYTLVWTSIETDATRAGAWNDYDADGDLDFAVGNYGQVNRVYRNDGGDSFSLIWSSAETDNTEAISWADYNGDGDSDMLAGNYTQAQRIYRNDGAGVFTLAWSSAETDKTLGAAWGDYDGDGDADFLMGNESQVNRVFHNGEDPVNAAPAIPASVAEADGAPGTVMLQWAAAADDNTPAAAVMYQVRVGTCSGCNNITSGAFSPRAGNAGASLSYVVSLPNQGTYYWTVAAVDNTSFATSGWATEDVFVLTWPTYTLQWTTTETDTTEDVAAGDYDRDGDLDLLVGNAGLGEVNRVYKNATGSYSLVWSSAEAEITNAVAWGDYDLDGDLDQAVGNLGQANRVYRNGGGDAFTSVWSSTDTRNTTSIAWGDYDNDGDLDVIAGNLGQANRIYRNTGGGNFSAAWDSTETDNTYAIAAGDYDADGDLDHLAGNFGQANRVYRNNGNGTFTTVWSSGETDNTYAAAWGDYDADGDLDQYVGNNGVNRVYRNDGGGAFSLLWSSAEADDTRSVAWTDFDGDGKLDLLAMNNGTANRAYRGDGAGAFTLSWSSTETDSTLGGAAVDYDKDGDVDHFAGNNGANRLYKNNKDHGNSAPAAPTLVAESGAAPGTFVLQWSAPADDHTPAAALTYQVRVGTCSGCGNVVSGVYAPPYGNAGATESLTIGIATEATYYWSVSAVDAHFATSSWATQNSFAVYADRFGIDWSSTETDNTRGVAWGDYDGDGDLDQLVGNYNNQSSRVYRNDGGSFTLAWTAPSGAMTTSVAWGDNDGDGDLDILLGNAGQANRIYRNDGGDAFTSVWTSAETDTTFGIAWGDYDGDGDLDQLVANNGANRVYRNDDNGSYTMVWTATDTYMTYSVAWGDYDSDGDLDQLVGNYGTTQDQVFRNDGDDDFTLVWETPQTEGTYGIAWGDYDGDGDLDIGAANCGFPMRVYENVGGGSFTLAWSSTETDCARAIAWGDYDTDGLLDFVIVTNDSYRNRAYKNNGDGTFSLDWSSDEFDLTTTVSLGDYDGDGDLDQLTGNTSASNRVYGNLLNNGNTAPTAPAPVAEPDTEVGGAIRLEWAASTDAETPAAELTYVVRVGTCSGCDNVVSGAFAPPYGNAGASTAFVVQLPEKLRTYYWSVAGVDKSGFATSTWSAEDSFTINPQFEIVWSGAAATSTAAAWGDYDDDGDLDALVGNDGGANRLYRNDGSDTFTQAWVSTETDNARSVAWGDYDGDGDLDQLVGNFDPASTNRVYRNDGGGAFTLAWSSAEGDDSKAVWGDFDKDGDLDQFVANAWATGNSYYRNDGNNIFNLTWTSAESDSSMGGAAAADYDGDGDLDLLVGNYNVGLGQANRVYRNNANGTFTLAWSSIETDDTYSVAWGDYDGDGDPDQAVGNDGVDRVYRNDGGGAFTLVWSSVEADLTNSVAWGDYDGDGDNDLLTGGSGPSGAANRIYRNDGGGVFTLAWSSTRTDKTGAAAWGDYDGDGDLDQLVANSSGYNYVYKNNLDPANSAPAAPSLTAEPDATPGTVTLQWAAPADDNTAANLLTYQIRLATSSGGSGIVSGAFAPPAGNSATVSYSIALTATSTYYWSVAAIDNTGFSKSAWSSEGSFYLGPSAFEPVWSSAQSDDTTAAAWGDYDRDGDLDQLVGNLSQANRVYRNDGATFTLVWSSTETDPTRSVAWGDYDRDGDLDQLVGNDGAVSRVYKNNGGDSFTVAWSAPAAQNTWAASWGDYDNDGDADILVGNTGAANRVYRNDGGDTFTAVWNSAEADNTSGVAWGDYDNDGDLDHLAGNSSQANRVYENNGDGTFTAIWSSAETDDTLSVAWADYDGDGDLDHSAMNFTGANRLYRNDGGGAFTLVWSSAEAEDTAGGGWGDFDGDGDFDHIAVNYGQTNRVYKNTGAGFTVSWSSTETEDTAVGGWGDYDGDGDLDQLVPNYAQANRVYRNNTDPPNSPPAAPTLNAVADTRLEAATAAVTLTWNAPADDNTPAALLTYVVRAATCSGCGNVVTGVAAPPFNLIATTSYKIVVSAIGTYYWTVAAVDSTGFATSAWAVEGTFVITEGTDPTVTDNQGGDNTWRAATGTTYDVDFSDAGGSTLDKAQYSMWSGAGMTGSMILDWTDIASGIASNSYATDWQVSFGAATDGVNYVSVRAIDYAGNYSQTSTDAFYLRKDTVAPAVTDNQGGDNTWRAAAGTAYDVDFGDSHSLLNNVQYAMWTGPGLTGTMLSDWTDIAAALATDTYTTNWQINYGSATGGMNYISARAYDNAGNVSAVSTDAFYVKKDDTEPVAGAVTPANTDYGGLYVDAAFDFSTAFTDGESGVATCAFCLSTDGVCDTEWTAATWTVGTCVATGTTCADGQSLTLNMTAINNAALTATGTEITRECDAADPTTTDDWVDAWTATSPVTVTLSATDTAAGVAATYYCIDTTNACAPSTAAATASVTCSSGATCTQYVRYYSVDNVGNAEAVTFERVRQDRMGPVGGSLTYTSGATTTTTIDVTFVNGADAESGVASREIQSSDATYSNGSCGVYGAWSQEVLNPGASPWNDAGLTTGNCRRYRYAETDNLGNVTYTCIDGTACAATSAVQVDTSAPGAVSSLNDGTGADVTYSGYTNSLSANWAAATDGESGVAGYWVGIGTSAGATNTLGWAWSGAGVATTVTGLTLVNGGQYFVSVQAQNAAGLTGSATSTNGQTIDNTAPTDVTWIYDSLGADTSYATSAAALSANWEASTDGESGIRAYWVGIGTTAGATNTLGWTDTGNVTATSVAGLTLTGGQVYYVSVKSESNAGLFCAATSTNGQLVDSTAPAATGTVRDGLSSDVDYATSATSLSTNWDAFTESESGIAAYWVGIGTSAGATNALGWTNAGAVTATTVTGLTLAGGNVYYFTVKAENDAGLVGSALNSDGQSLDSTAPSTPTAVYDGPYSDIAYASSSTTLKSNWAASADAESGVTAYYYSIGTSAGATNTKDWTSAGTATGATTTGLTLVNGSAYYFNVKAVNGAGLESGTASSDGQTVDTTAPASVSSVSDGTGSDISYSTSSTTLSANWAAASDAESGIVEYLYAVGTSSGSTNVLSYTTSGLATGVTNASMTLTDGVTYYVSVKARNGAVLDGNPKSSNGVKVDTTAPSTIVNVYDGTGSDADYASSTTTLSANWSASADAHTGVARYWYAVGTTAGATDTLDWASCGTAQTVSLTGLTLTAGQQYYFTVKAENNAGLFATAANSDGLTIDNTAPDTVASVSDGTGLDVDITPSSTELSANWTASADAESGVAKYWYAVGTTAGGVDTVGWTNNSTSTEVTKTGLTLTEGETYYFSVKAENGAGLFSTPTYSNGQAAGVMFDKIWSSAQTGTSNDAAWGDYDGDGDLDIAVGNSGSGETNRVYRNDDGGTFTLAWTSTEADVTNDVAWGDFDNDGDLDFAAGNTGANRVYRYDGGGAFTLLWSSTQTDSTNCVAWGDYDRDGDLDLFAGNDGQVNRFYRNDGGGTFTLDWSTTETDNTDDAEWGDFDNDNDLDLLVVNDRNQNRVYENDGAGGFSVGWSSSETDASANGDWGDFDADGDLDQLIANVSTGYGNRVYSNDGAGSFSLTWTSSTMMSTQGTAWGDYDGDGDLDILEGNTSGVNRIYRNDGGGSFTQSWISTETDNTMNVEWGDYDGDGDLDQLAANSGAPVRVYRNNQNIYNASPSAPAPTAEPDGNSGLITLQWTASTDDITPGAVLEYHVRVGTTPGGAEISSGATTGPRGNAGSDESLALDLEPGSYYWAVAAIDAAGFTVSAWSAEDSFTLTDTNAPAFAGLTSVNTCGSGCLKLQWTAASDAEGSTPITYNIFYSAASGAQDFGTPNATTTNTNRSIYGLTNGTPYYFVARAEDSIGNEDPNTVQLSGTPMSSDTTAPATPAGFIAVPGDGQVSLAWVNPSDVDFLEVVLVRKTGGYPASMTDGTELLRGTDSNTTDTGLTNGTTYYYTLFACDTDQNCSYTTASAAPSAVTVFGLDAGWNLITLSKTPANGDHATIFAGEDVTVCAYTTAAGLMCENNAAFPDLAAAGAYWTHATDAVSTITVSGTDITASTYEIALTTGWNGVGNPYAVPVAWSDAAISVKQGSNPAVALSAAGSLIDTSAYYFDTASQRHGAVPAGAGFQLNPWKGYWIKAKQNCTLVITKP